MRTPAQIEASRNNGSKSNGPKSESGKARSSENAIKHGFFSVKTVVIDGESEEEWEQYRQGWFARLHPRDFVEERIVLEIAVNQWRLERAWALRTATVDQETSIQRPIIEEAYERYDAALVHACSHAARKEDLLALDQHEARLSRNADRAYRKLKDIRAEYPVEPILENEPEPPRIEANHKSDPHPEQEKPAENKKSENEPEQPALTPVTSGDMCIEASNPPSAASIDPPFTSLVTIFLTYFLYALRQFTHSPDFRLLT